MNQDDDGTDRERKREKRKKIPKLRDEPEKWKMKPSHKKPFHSLYVYFSLLSPSLFCLFTRIIGCVSPHPGSQRRRDLHVRRCDMGAFTSDSRPIISCFYRRSMRWIFSICFRKVWRSNSRPQRVCVTPDFALTQRRLCGIFSLHVLLCLDDRNHLNGDSYDESLRFGSSLPSLQILLPIPCHQLWPSS